MEKRQARFNEVIEIPDTLGLTAVADNVETMNLPDAIMEEKREEHAKNDELMERFTEDSGVDLKDPPAAA